MRHGKGPHTHRLEEFTAVLETACIFFFFSFVCASPFSVFLGFRNVTLHFASC